MIDTDKSPLRYKDLVNGERKRVLVCLDCGGEYSADGADYFWAKPDESPMCCNEPLERATKTTRYKFD